MTTPVLGVTPLVFFGSAIYSYATIAGLTGVGGIVGAAAIGVVTTFGAGVCCCIGALAGMAVFGLGGLILGRTGPQRAVGGIGGGIAGNILGGIAGLVVGMTGTYHAVNGPIARVFEPDAAKQSAIVAPAKQQLAEATIGGKTVAVNLPARPGRPATVTVRPAAPAFG